VILSVTSPIVINVPTRGLLAVETRVLLFCGWQNLNIKRRLVCKQWVSLYAAVQTNKTSPIKHANKRNVLRFWSNVWWPSDFNKHDQTRSNTIKQHQTRCPNGKMFGHQTMFDGVWSPNIYRLSGHMLVLKSLGHKNLQLLLGMRSSNKHLIILKWGIFNASLLLNEHGHLPFFISKLKFSYDKYSVGKVWTKIYCHLKNEWH